MSARRCTVSVFALLTLVLVLAAGAPAAFAGGFEVDAQSARALGLGGAVTAQTDEPAAVFYNPAGLAFLQKGGVSVGVAAPYLNESQLQGLEPGIGAGMNGEQESGFDVLGHVFAAKPLKPGLVVGMGAYSPYWLSRDWSGADTFPGRRIATSSQIRSWDVSPSVGLLLTPKLGVGVGAVVRLSDVSAKWRLSRTNPRTGEVVDVAVQSASTDMELGVGWTAGILHRPSPRFSWGLSYRSAIETDYIGVAPLTQIATGDDLFDDLVAASLPFDQDLALVIDAVELPARASFGVMVGLTPTMLLEVDATWTEWSSLQEIPFVLQDNPSLSRTSELRFEDAMSYRAGLRLIRQSGAEFRFGYAFEDTPQPDETVGPFLADARRNTFSAGFGKDWLDLGLSYSQWDDRTTFTNVDDLNGTYRTNAYVFSLTITQ